VTGAGYAAIGVPDRAGGFERFLTAAVDSATWAPTRCAPPSSAGTAWPARCVPGSTCCARCRGVRTVDGPLTGWHEPAASHLLMLEAVAGRQLLVASSSAALAGGYRWHEFDDLHLILPR
jgi:hypothetical protein